MDKEKRVLNDFSFVLGGTKRLLSYWAGNHDYKLYVFEREFVFPIKDVQINPSTNPPGRFDLRTD